MAALSGANLRARVRAHLSNAACTLSAAAEQHYGEPWWPDLYLLVKAQLDRNLKYTAELMGLF